MRSNRPRLPGELSETERHWDYLCMTVIAIDTAVMGAVPLLVGVAAANDPPRGLAAAIGTALIGVAAAFYLAAVGWSVRAIFSPPQNQSIETIRWKRSNAGTAFQLSGCLMFVGGLIMYFHLIHPAIVGSGPESCSSGIAQQQSTVTPEPTPSAPTGIADRCIDNMSSGD